METKTATRVLNLTPCLMVTDVTRTIDFYGQVLGFEPTLLHPGEENPLFAILARDGIELMVERREAFIKEYPALTGRDFGGSLTLYLRVENVTGLFEAVRDRATLVHDLHVTEYGMMEFAMEDCNGYILCFAECAGLDV